MRPNEEGETFRGGSVRKYFTKQIMESFPDRKFILVGDTTNPSTLSSYTSAFWRDPNHVLCIFIRNVTASDPTNWMGYDTSGFAGMPRDRYMFFDHPEDLMGLDVVNGKCLNRTLEQYVQFEKQDGKVDEDRDEGAGPLVSPTMPLLASMAVFMAAFAMMW